MPTLQWSGSTIRWTEWNVSLGPRRIPGRVILVHFDPRKVSISLEVARRDNAIAPWSIDEAPEHALLAFNAGQFTDAGPWGWVVHRGREWQAPGNGSLAGAFVVDSSGRADILDATGMRNVRDSKRAVEAVQSYPMLLTQNGVFPAALCGNTDDINLEHRDTRLAIGVRVDGTVIVAMTRYDGAGAIGDRLPIGPTTPEMAEIMRRAGAVRAMMLDGGLSAQMLVRQDGNTKQWPGLRSVPLAIVVR
jgi:exopolysaccharide biosynthesis protein